jgi:dipeptidyl-peptidase-4
MTDSFPRQQARTQRFTLGAPRSFRISPDGSRVAFLRSQGGTDPVTCLWVLDAATGDERLVADPAAVGDEGGQVSEEEKARRERLREQAGGIVAYATDDALSVAAFSLSGRAYLADLAGRGSGGVQELAARSPTLDPRPDPAGRHVAYVCDGALRVTGTAGGGDRELIGPAGEPGVTYGLAEFIAAEEMGRYRGYWWAPDGSALLVARVDERPVTRWHIADPANPGRAPAEVGYPAAGTPNADVSLLLVRLDGTAAEVVWDRAAFGYLVTVTWEAGGPLIVVQSRDQRRMRLLAADPASGATRVLREDTSDVWLDIVPGVPAWTSDQRIVWTLDSADTKRLLVASPAELSAAPGPVTPPGLHVQEVISADGDAVLFTASGEDPTQTGVWQYSPGGLTRVSPEGGVHSARRAGGTTVLVSAGLAGTGSVARILRDDPDLAGTGPVARVLPDGPDPAAALLVTSLAQRPSLPAFQPDIFAAGERRVATALLLPSWHRPGTAKLPVLVDPYGGPHMQRVIAAKNAYLTSQWFAEQGFAVVVADGRGTPGRGIGWERAVARDLAGPVLDDQVTALHAAADRCGDLDTGRVGIRGWSFGGYLAALAVLRRPDVFHAAVAGAPVTDWRLYDTHYTERYLGHPDDSGAVYDATSLLTDAPKLRRPLLLIHGLADDNVVVAHTLRLSSALLAAGRPHTVLPLSGVTHMTPQEEVAENLLLLQVEFLRRSLGVTAPGPAGQV